MTNESKRKLALENKILVFRTGSQLYGTDTPTSDLDKVGVFLSPASNILGLHSVENIDLSVKDKGDDGRNTEDAIDFVFHEFTKFVSLALDNNPNVIELLFANQENILFCNDVGQKLLDNAHLFPCQELYYRFKGYAESQKHKMRIRTHHWHNLREGYELIKELETEHNFKNTPLNEIYGDLDPTFDIRDDFIKIGDINLQLGESVKSARRKIEQRINKFSSRSDLISKYGFDTKFGSHLIRLLIECIELLETGKIEFPLKEAQLIKDIKEGRYSIDDVLNLSSYYEEEAEKALDNTDLPKDKNFDEVNDFVVKVQVQHVFDTWKEKSTSK